MRAGCSVCGLVDILTPGTRGPELLLKLPRTLVPSLCLFTYKLKKSDEVKKVRGRCESGTRAEFGSQETG